MLDFGVQAPQYIWKGVRSPKWLNGDRTIKVYEADSGKLLWEKKTHVAPLTLAADAKRVYFHDTDRIVAPRSRRRQGIVQDGASRY